MGYTARDADRVTATDPVDPRCDFCLHADACEAAEASLTAVGRMHLVRCFSGGSRSSFFHFILSGSRKNIVRDYASHGQTFVVA